MFYVVSANTILNLNIKKLKLKLNYLALRFNDKKMHRLILII